MKPETDFVAAARAAQHAPELLRPRRRAPDPGAALTELGETIAPMMADALAVAMAGAPPGVRVEAVATASAEAFAAMAPALAATRLFTVASRELALVFDGAAILRLLDRAFGGRGEAPAALPTSLPLSAALLLGQVEDALAALLPAALGLSGASPATVVARAPAFAPSTPLGVVTFAIGEAGGAAWNLLLAVPLAELGQAPASPRRAVDAVAGAMGAVPLTLVAELATARLPVRVLAGLVPGQTIALPTPRDIALRAGATIIARGSMGAVDDRAALSITSAFTPFREPSA